MAGFSEIIGQEHIVEHFTNAIAADKVSHAYMIHGELGAGKEFIAKAFAMALQCQEEGVGACGECHSCKQALSGNHPDIIQVIHEKPNTIGVDDIRLQVNQDIGIKPYSGPKKIYIIGESEKMTAQAQNALLKTLEEPPPYGVILILTTNVDSLLPTIRSRCVILHMRPVRDQRIKEYLMQDLHIPDYKAEVCAAFARGNVGKAKSLAGSEDFEKIREDAVTLMKYIQDMEIVEIITAIRRINDYNFDVNSYLDILYIWYRDVLLFKATKDVNHLIFKEEIQYIKKVAGRCSYEGVENIMDALDKAKARLVANVKFDLTMELLLLTIKENS
ncbi:MAG: DNA polymerase III subunit delta' [Lachnospiraceae bacterium]|nr:DNA polymerase III subunit delta' [Lachnospiraceae bacterium]